MQRFDNQSANYKHTDRQMKKVKTESTPCIGWTRIYNMTDVNSS